VVLDDGEDVVVAGYDPEVELGRVEDRLLLARAVEDRERVLALRRVERIEGDAGDLVPLPAMLSSFWVASTKREAARVRGAG
jgi:hypothetical protein